MSEPKFTRPPWRVRDEDGPPVTNISGGMGDRLLATAYPKYYAEHPSADALLRSYEEAEANARLIAAAPDLYAQLEDARVTLEEAAKLMVSHYPSVANNLVNQCGIRCGDALAKARGER